MAEEPSLEGLTPEAGDAADLARVVDMAFEYRGDVSVDRKDGSTIVGYLYNRNAEGKEPFVELIEAATEARLHVPYDAIRTIRFTGKDTAAGKSYDAWTRRRDVQSRASRARG